MADGDGRWGAQAWRGRGQQRRARDVVVQRLRRRGRRAAVRKSCVAIIDLEHRRRLSRGRDKVAGATSTSQLYSSHGRLFQYLIPLEY